MGTLTFNDDFIETGLDGVKPQSWNTDVYPHFVAIRTLLNGNVDATNLGVTTGTIAASKVVTVDANKDAGSFRNITLTGELDAGSLDVSGSADIAGDLTLSAGADGALRFSVASSVKILDNSATSLVFEEADTAYMTFVTTNSSEAIKFDKALDINANMDVDADVDVTGTTTLNGVLQVKNGATSAGKIEIYEDSDDATLGTVNKLTLLGPALAGDVALTLPDATGSAGQLLSTNGSGGVMSWVTPSYAPAAGSGSIVTTGALTSGSIASGFGTIATTNTLATNTATFKTTDAGAGSVKTIAILEWDPASGTMTDASSGIGIDFKMPDDANNQDVYASINAHCESDATGAEDGSLSFKIVVAGTNTEKMILDETGLTVTNDITSSSDERIKINIQTIDKALEKVTQLRGASFIKDGKESIGVIAQEVEEIVPEVVVTGKDEEGLKSVAYGNMVGLLIEAIKEQQIQIDKLTNV